MKLCDIVRAYTAGSGGIKTYVDTKRGYLLLNTGYEHLMIVPAAKDRVIKMDRQTVYEVKSPCIPGIKPYRLIVSVRKVADILRRERPDLVEFDSPYILPWIARMYCRESGVPLVGFYHADFPTAYAQLAAERLFGQRAGKLARRWCGDYARKVYNRCDTTIVSAELNAEKLRSYGVRSVDVVPLGVDLETFHPARRENAVRRRLGVSDSGLLLVYAGRLDMEKRVRVLVDAFRMLPGEVEATLALIGSGPLEDELREQACQVPRLKVLPFTSEKRELARLLASSDIYVTAGPYETFGLSVVEAQACGLPVVGVRAGALIERVLPRVGLLGEVDNPAEMAANIAALSGNGIREMGQRARELVEERFSWDSACGRILDIYHRLTGVGRGPAARIAAGSESR